MLEFKKDSQTTNITEGESFHALLFVLLILSGNI